GFPDRGAGLACRDRAPLGGRRLRGLGARGLAVSTVAGGWHRLGCRLAGIPAPASSRPLPPAPVCFPPRSHLLPPAPARSRPPHFEALEWVPREGGQGQRR